MTVSMDRILGGIAVLLGGFLLLYMIPANVTSVPGSVFSPSLFPNIAAWMIIVLGVVQFFSAPTEVDLPPTREILRLLFIDGLALATLFLMEHIGYIPSAIALMAAATLMVYERRPVWIITTVIAMPLG
ncbi:MAG: tripartite tricarboxylate transporter TctB family protein, partial [Paracoccaceae bacterium]